jgi:hypothetical protein
MHGPFVGREQAKRSFGHVSRQLDSIAGTASSKQCRNALQEGQWPFWDWNWSMIGL